MRRDPNDDLKVGPVTGGLQSPASWRRLGRQLMLRDPVRLPCALDGCRDNTDMEAFHRFRHENQSLTLDAAILAELERVVGQRFNVDPWGYRV